MHIGKQGLVRPSSLLWVNLVLKKPSYYPSNSPSTRSSWIDGGLGVADRIKAALGRTVETSCGEQRGGRNCVAKQARSDFHAGHRIDCERSGSLVIKQRKKYHTQKNKSERRTKK